MRRLLLLAFSALAQAAAAWGQPGVSGGFVRYGPAEGLPTLTVVRVVQDRRGLLWAGTEEGLVRYDGVRFRAFQADPSDPHALADNVAVAVAPDAAGGVWVATPPDVLQRFDPRTERFTRVPTGIDSVALNPLLDDGRGSLWIGTTRGLYRHDVARGVTRRVRDVPGPVAALAVGARGGVWVAAGGGLFRTTDSGPSRAAALPPEAGRPRSLAAGVGGRLVVGADHGVLAERPDGAFAWAMRRPGLLATAVAADPYGAVWAGTPGGVWRLPPGGARPEHFAHAPGNPATLPVPRVLDVRVDASGTLWVALASGGLAARPTRPSPFALTPGPLGPDSPSVKAVVAEADGTLWIGGFNGGLCESRAGPRPRCRRSVATPLPNGQIHALARAADGVLWVAARDDGVRCLPPGAARLGRCPVAPERPGIVRDVHAASDGAVYVAARDSGLFRYRSGAWERVRLPAPAALRAGGLPWTLGEAPDGAVWVGTYEGGAHRLDPATGRARHYAPASAPDPGSPREMPLRVVTFAFTPDGAVWAGSMNEGVARLNAATGAVRRFGPADGLPALTVSALATDGRGRLWAFSDAGASRFDATTGRFTTYGPREGFPAVSPYFDAAARDPDGRLYVGTSGGLVSFHPDDLAPPGAAAPAVWPAALRVNGDAHAGNAAYLERLSLPYYENVVSVDLAAADPGPERTWTYAYHVDGPGREPRGWENIGRRTTLDLGALAPGRHTLAVRAEAGTNRGAVRRVVFDVGKPPWGRGDVRAAVALALALALYGLYRYRLASLLRVERTRRRIADDLHDDLGSKLAALAVGLETAGRYGPPDDAPDTLVRSADDARDITENLRDAVWSIDERRDTLASLVDRAETFARNLLGERCHVERPASLPVVALPMEHRRHLFFLLKEALHNAHRHAGGAPVRLRVEIVGRTATFAVEDAGPGFDPTAVNGDGRGLATLRRRAHAAGAAFGLDTAPGQGTRVTVRYPIPRRA